MDYVYQYDLTAIILLSMLLFLYRMRYNYPTATNKIYISMVVLSLVSAVSDLVSLFSISIPEAFPLWLNYLINIVFLLSYNGIMILFMAYMLVIADPGKILKREKIFVAASVVTEAFLLLTTPFTKLIFYFDAELNYKHGPLFIVLILISGLTMAYIIYLFVKFRKHLTVYQKLSICFFCTATIVAFLIQAFYPEQLIVNFVNALFLVIAYVSLQNPDDYIDKNTHCFNNSAFIETIEKNIEKQHPFNVIAFMPDDFGYINQVLGNKAGNKLIEACAKFLTDEFDKKIVYHMSGCRFALITENGSPSNDEAAKKIMDYFSKPTQIEGIEIQLSPYICIIRYPDFAVAAEDVFDAIDYSFKELAQNRDIHIITATGESLKAKRRENQIIHIMKEAVMNDGFSVFYQPIYSLKDEAFTSAEALIRLNNTELGYISPDEFIPMAERNGMIIEIGDIVFRNVCRFLNTNDAEKLGIKYIEVNLSTVQCMQDNLANRMLDIMQEYKIPSERINFEITETAGSINDDTLNRNMNTLIQRGTTFSMDDYGTGFSTANYLIRLPLHIVKIDKSILWPAMKDAEAFVILKHTVQMLKALDKKIVVEGVETQEMCDTLREMGCDFLQGYLYSKPVPGDEFVSFLQKYNTKMAV
ncbi:MAG: EAL domain-containing protein [Huintestinicola sp.]